MRWLIVEDALRDRKGHCLEWITTFSRGFRALGDEVTVLSGAAVQPDIKESLGAIPILPESIWHTLGDGSGAVTRHKRMLAHAWHTWRVMRRYLKADPGFDAIFVPTTALSHLLAWAWLVKRILRTRPTRLLLFFVFVPLRVTSSSRTVGWDGSSQVALLTRVLRWLGPEIRSGKVVLGVETKVIRESLENLVGVPVTYFPQPVLPLSIPASLSQSDGTLEMGSFGGARSEKGSDVLQQALLAYRAKAPASRARFTIQWINDFPDQHGNMVTKSGSLIQDPCVRYLSHYFKDGEYGTYLSRTQTMLLPYRLSSYAVRGSRVVIEAVVNGIPVIATRGTTLATVAHDFGSGLTCEDGDPASLVQAMAEMELRFGELSEAARLRQTAAANHFSVRTFREYFKSKEAR
jgi:glycosyltransferase involved in cell wall biosynthesis